MPAKDEAAQPVEGGGPDHDRLIDELKAEIARKDGEIKIIQRISSEINSTLDLDKILEIILNSLDAILAFKHCMILLADPAGEMLRLSASRGYEDPNIGAEVGVGQGVIGVAAKRRRIMRMGNIQAQLGYLSAVRSRIEAAGQGAGLQDPTALPGLPDAQSQLAIPLVVSERLVGVFAVESAEANAFDVLDELLLSIIANQVASAIDNARLHQAEMERTRERDKAVQDLNRFGRYLSPQIAQNILEGEGDELFKSHRREVTVAFMDLRGFTTFCDIAEPEEVIELLQEYHAEMGRLIFRYEGTVEHFAGDGIMAFFNDPIPREDHTEMAVRMALDMQASAKELRAGWNKKGFKLDLGIGLAAGYATLGTIGFEGRRDYGAVGNVTILASRLSSEAKGGQILANQRALSKVEEIVEAKPLGEIQLKGFARPVAVSIVVKLKE